MLTALLNLALGLYLRPRGRAWRRSLQRVGSLLLLIIPAGLTVAFFVEPAPQTPERPLSLGLLVITLFGLGLHVLAGFRDRDLGFPS